MPTPQSVYQPPPPPPIIPQIPPLDLVEPNKSNSTAEQNNQFLKQMESDYLYWDSAVYTQ